MNQTTLTNAANAAKAKSKNLIAAQIDRQAQALGSTVAATARDLRKVGEQLRRSGTIGGAASLADWAAGYVGDAGSYLQSGDTDRFISDLEAFARRRPWTLAASAAALGFAGARVVKSSSAQRLHATTYATHSAAYDDDDYAFESSAIRPTGATRE
jgi:hypothetical protein